MAVTVLLDKITKQFETPGGGITTAVNDVSMNIKGGSFVTLLGPSGCGKTTTLRMIAGFEVPDSGKIYIDGDDITFMPPNMRGLAMVFQSYALFPHLTVSENIAYGLKLRKFKAGVIRERVKEVLEMVGLEGLEDRYTNQLSGGQQQRVALARAIVIRPRVILFDEPLSNLDAKLRDEMRGKIRELQQKLKITAVYVTHDQIEAMTMSDQIVVMNKGRIEQVGSPNEIYEYPASRFVADFIGRVNLLPAKRIEIDGGRPVVDLLGSQIALSSYSSEAPDYMVAVRPEVIKLQPDNDWTGPVYHGRLLKSVYVGQYMEYLIRLQTGLKVTVIEFGHRTDIHSDQNVSIGLNPHTLHGIPA